ncbi:MAG: serine/threonine-protein kinase [Pirellulaceae bacterium]|nr:serine/threonine-protein kinase [Pirellulaceae bacterium]
MAIHCPLCGHGMNFKDIKPGKFQPKCPKCQQRFGLTISDDPLAAPKVSKLPAAAQATAAAVAPAAKTQPAARHASQFEATLPPAPSKTAVVEATLPPSPVTASPQPEVAATLPPTQMGNFDATSPLEQGRQATHAESAPARANGEAIPEKLGGYRLLKELGRGAMGAVYLANQLSLDRHVALKLIQAQWAANPVFVARFTREAYAAAQLTHHNVVQIYDLGQDGGINYFSMEFVSGKSLADLVMEHGKLDPEQAVGYVLQAARGLDFAHRRGMVHRDVKPANLMLNEQGIVKVADLGLVKTPQLLEEPQVTGEAAPATSGPGSSLAAATADVTLTNMAMGTPAYMAPEQAVDAAGVDHRSDIYSLGCTLYVLLTGRPPFEGASALEVITKHRNEPVVRPEVLVKRISPALSEIVLQMVAKEPADRYQTLGEVITALEGFLGIASAGPFSPGEQQVASLEAALRQYNSAPLARLRGPVQLGFIALSAGLFVVLLFVSWWGAALVAALAVSAAMAYFLVGGWLDRSMLFEKARSYLLALRISDWLTLVGGGLISLLVCYLAGWLLPALVGCAVGTLLGAGCYLLIDRPLAIARRAPLAELAGLVKTLRIRGVEEEAIQLFVVKYSNDTWEEFFEAGFGYEAKLKARESLTKSDLGRRRPKFRAWRDGLIRHIDAKLRRRQDERERQHLRKVEEENLKAQGVAPEKAREQANLLADALLDDAVDARQQQAAGAAAAVDPKVIAAQKRARQLKMLSDARSGRYRERGVLASLAGLVTGPLGFALGGKVRFLAGAMLIAIFALWLKTNTNLADAAHANGSTQQRALGMLDVLQTFFTNGEQVTTAVAGFNSVAPGVVGVILLVLGLFGGWRMSLFAWPAAAIALVLPGVIGLDLVCYGSATGLAVVGLLLGRTPAE